MRRSAVAAATLMTLAFAAPAFAAGTKTRERLRIVGHTVTADWSFIEGNIGTFVNVVATENDESGTAGKSETAFVALSISRFEVDTGNVLIAGVAFADGPESFDFTIDKQLGSATLRVRDAIFQDDNSFTFFNVDMDLTWTATGEAFTGKSNDRFKEPGMTFHSNFHGTFRPGVASGSILGKDIPTGTSPTIQFTPVPSANGMLQFDKFGSMTIITTTP